MNEAPATARQPILLFAMPRSGSTWVAKIFDSHPGVIYRHEPDSVERLDLGLATVPPYSEQQKAMVRDFVQRLSERKPIDVSGKLPLFPKSYRPGPAHFVHTLSIYGAKAMSRAGLAARVPDFIAPRRRAQSRVVWKSIESLARLPLFMEACPDLCALHLVRHPCGQISSVLRGEKARKFESSRPSGDDYGIFEQFEGTDSYRRNNLSREKLASLSVEERLAWRWVLFNDTALELCQHRDGYRLLPYESLCEDPSGIAREIFAHCGLSWHAQTSAFIADSAGTDNDEYYSIKRDPARAAQRWRTELDAGQIERILGITRQSRSGALFGT